MSTEDELNEELGSYGYKLDTFALKDSNYQVSRLDGYGGHAATFKDVEDLRTFLKRLAARGRRAASSARARTIALASGRHNRRCGLKPPLRDSTISPTLPPGNERDGFRG